MRSRSPLAAWSPRLPLFWRVALVNAAVFTVATLALALAPATISSPIAADELDVLLVGLACALVLNALLIRRTFTPLYRLRDVMRSVDPLEPGRRLELRSGDPVISELTQTFNAMLDRLERSRLESGRRTTEVQEAERRRIAHELHDEVGQSLTAVVLHLGRLARSAPVGEAQLDEVREAVRDALETIRTIALQLRPEALDDLGLSTALEALVDKLSLHAGIPIDQEVDPALPALSPERELAIYRVAQEGLTNALRHARASRLRLSLIGGGDHVVLRVSDNGSGFEGSTRGLGCDGMRERALIVGGDLCLARAPEGGAEVRLRVPAGAA
jgi:two-component system sensor histidine kinase UhpB